MDGGAHALQEWAEGACFERDYPTGAATLANRQGVNKYQAAPKTKTIYLSQLTRGAPWI